MRTIDPNPSIPIFSIWIVLLNAWHRSFVRFTFSCGPRVTWRSKVLENADRFLCRQQFGRERNILADICDGIAGCRNQLQMHKNRNRQRRIRMEINKSSPERTFPPWVKMWPPPLISCPLIAVTPPAIAFTAWKMVFKIDFFNCHPSNGISFSCKSKDEFRLFIACYQHPDQIGDFTALTITTTGLSIETCFDDELDDAPAADEADALPICDVIVCKIEWKLIWPSPAVAASASNCHLRF